MFRFFFWTFAFLLLLLGCTNIDCPLDNQVEMRLHFYNISSKAEVALIDSLSVRGLRGGTTLLLLNRAFAKKSVNIPLNSAVDCDTLLFRFSGTEITATDTLFVQHQRNPHFESLDCPASMFHTLKEVSIRSRASGDTLITLDSVSIVNPNVKYEDVDNIKVFLRIPAGRR